MTRRVAAGVPTGGQYAAGARAESGVSLEAPDQDWRNQQVIVDGRPFTLGDVYGGRLFHGSPHPIENGGSIEPGLADANFKQSDDATVSITSGADTAHHWAREAARGRPFYVYEVEPQGAVVEVWRAALANGARNFRLAEGRVSAARVVRRVDLDDARCYEGALMRGEDPLSRTEAAMRDDVEVDAAIAFAEEYCAAAGGARPGMCFPAAKNIEAEFGWKIVGGARDGLTHYWNATDDGRWFDATAAMFGDEGPRIMDAGDPRYEFRFNAEPI